MASFISTAETAKPFIVEGGLIKKRCKPRLSYYRAVMSSELKQSIWEDSGSCEGMFIHTQEVKKTVRQSLTDLQDRTSLAWREETLWPVKLLTNPAESFQSSNSVSSHSFCGGLLGTCLTLNHPCFCKLSLTHAPVINFRQLAGAHVELWWYCFFGLLLVPYLRWADIHISPKNPVT